MSGVILLILSTNTMLAETQATLSTCSFNRWSYVNVQTVEKLLKRKTLSTFVCLALNFRGLSIIFLLSYCNRKQIHFEIIIRIVRPILYLIFPSFRTFFREMTSKTDSFDVVGPVLGKVISYRITHIDFPVSSSHGKSGKDT